MPFEYLDEPNKTNSKFEYIDDEVETPKKTVKNSIDLGAITSEAASFLNPFKKVAEVSEKEYAQTPVKNLPESAGNLAKGALGAIVNPIDTSVAVGGTMAGGIEKLVPGQQNEEAMFDNAVNEIITKRYGSLENFQNTVQQDPASVMADLSAVLGGSGAAMRVLGKLGVSSKLGAAGRAAMGLADSIDPFTQTINATGKAANKYLRPFAGTVDREVSGVAARHGIELPASAKNASPGVQIIEKIASRGIFGGKINKVIEDGVTKLNNVLEGVIQKTGKSPDPVIAGQEIAAGFDDFRRNWFETKDKLYSEAAATLRGQNKPNTGYFGDFTDVAGLEKPITVKAGRSVDWLDGIIQRKASAGKGFSDNINDFIEMRDSLRGNLDIRDMKTKLSELNRKIRNRTDPIASGHQAELKKLAEMMSEDLDDAVSQIPGYAEAIQKANAHYKEGIGLLNSKWGEKIYNLKDNPGKIIEMVTSKSVSVEDIPRIYEVIGEEAKPSLQAAFLNKLFVGAKNPSTKNFTPEGLARGIKSIGEDKVKSILNEEQWNILQDAITIQRGLKRGQAIAEGSQTAFIGRLSFQIGATITNPVLAAKLILGDALFSKFIGTKTGQKLLTEGLGGGEVLQRNAKGLGRAANAAYQVNKTRTE